MIKLIKIPIILAMIWLFGFCWFIYQIPVDKSYVNNTETDAVIALTGGVNRVTEATKLLLENKSKLLFISGVSSPAYLRDSLKDHNINDKIIFGTDAKSTYENAIEINNWVKKYNLNSIRLVTSNYHMPRSKMLIKKLNPDLIIIEHPVFSKAFELKEWYKSSTTMKLLLLEYNKYLTLTISSIF